MDLQCNSSRSFAGSAVVDNILERVLLIFLNRGGAWCDIMDVRQGHNHFSDMFRHGSHQGQKVDDLIADLISSVVSPSSLPAIVAAEWGECLWTIYGNRRFHALKGYAQKCRQEGHEPAKIKIIVHRAPFDHLLDPDVSGANSFNSRLTQPKP